MKNILFFKSLLIVILIPNIFKVIQKYINFIGELVVQGWKVMDADVVLI